MDVLPVVAHVLTEKPAAKIAIQPDPDSSVKRFMEWFLPDFFDRLVFVPVETLAPSLNLNKAFLLSEFVLLLRPCMHVSGLGPTKLCAEKELLFLQPESLEISRPERLRISELSSALHQFPGLKVPEV